MSLFKLTLGLFLSSFLLAPSFAQTSALGVEDWVKTAKVSLAEADHLGLPFSVEVVNAATPSKVFLGYIAETKSCILFVNERVDLDASNVELLFSINHEVGHCLALREGAQNIDAGVTRLGESFADVYSLAWFYANKKESFAEAFALACQIRMLARRHDGAYDTLMAMKTAYVVLESSPHPIDPYQFAVYLFKVDRD